MQSDDKYDSGNTVCQYGIVMICHCNMIIQYCKILCKHAVKYDIQLKTMQFSNNGTKHVIHYSIKVKKLKYAFDVAHSRLW